jgi:hypothetical protein
MNIKQKTTTYINGNSYPGWWHVNKCVNSCKQIGKYRILHLGVKFCKQIRMNMILRMLHRRINSCKQIEMYIIILILHRRVNFCKQIGMHMMGSMRHRNVNTCKQIRIYIMLRILHLRVNFCKQIVMYMILRILYRRVNSYNKNGRYIILRILHRPINVCKQIGMCISYLHRLMHTNELFELYRFHYSTSAWKVNNFEWTDLIDTTWTVIYVWIVPWLYVSFRIKYIEANPTSYQRIPSFKTMLDSSLPPVVCRMSYFLSYLRYVCLFP